MKNNKKYKNIFIVAIIMCVISISSIIYNLYFYKSVKTIYNYTVQKNDDYKVLLKPNDFYETEILGADSYYASNSIKNYIIDFKYEFLGDKKTNLEYKYNVDAYLVGTVKNNDNQDKEVWNRKFILNDDIYNKENNIDKFSVNQQISIDYEYYNNLARSYEKAYKISIDSILKVRLNISYKINLNENIKEVEDYIELEIPITNTVSEIRENYEKTTNGEITTAQKENNVNENIINTILTIIFIISSIVIIYIIKLYIKIQKQQYTWKLNHILKYYKDIIITITNKPDLDNLKIINVSTFQDLIDLAEQTQRNILYYKDNNGKENIFCVIIDNYIYLLKNIDK